jgi:hypothetical protein
MFSIAVLDHLPLDSEQAEPQRSSETRLHRNVIFKEPLEEVYYFSSVDPPGAATVETIPAPGHKNKSALPVFRFSHVHSTRANLNCQ